MFLANQTRHDGGAYASGPLFRDTCAKGAWLLLLLSLGSCAACNDSKPEADPPTKAESPERAEKTGGPEKFAPLAAAAEGIAFANSSAPASGKMTLLAPKETGVDFVNPLQTDHPMNRLYYSGFSCGGVAIGDLDGNGLPDLFFTNGADRNRLYLNRGGMRFEETTEGAGIADSGAWSSGAALADIDGDGDLDIYVCQYEASNQLWINDGKGRFTEQAKRYKLDLVDASLAPYFVDYNQDGRLDLFLVTNSFYSPTGKPAKFKYYFDASRRPILEGESARYYRLGKDGSGHALFRRGRPDRLLWNGGDQGFLDVSEASGITGEGNGLSASWFDCDNDGDLDLYVANDFKDPDRLYRNNGDGGFTDIIGEAVPYTSWFTMGSVAADFNNDRAMDLFAVDMAATTHYMDKLGMGSMDSNAWFLDSAIPRQYMRNTLFMNTGTSRYLEIAQMAGVSGTDWSWAPVAADFDADGWTDLFVTNGVARNFMNSDVAAKSGPGAGLSEWEIYAKSDPRPEKNAAFRNLGGWKFETKAADWGLDMLSMSYGAATGDLDGDGDLDLVTTNLDANVSIYRNDISNAGSVTIELLDEKSPNRRAVGAVATLESSPLLVKGGSGAQTRMLMPQSGFLGSHEPILHFGLGKSNKSAARLEVRWPDGTITSHDDIKAGNFYRVSKNGASSIKSSTHGAGSKASKIPALFTSLGKTILRAHKETPFDDFATQPLLPNKLSQLGPGVAVADVDSDGSDDLFISTAQGQTSAVARRVDGKWELQSLPGTEDIEEMAPLFFDADGDGDSDLFVVSGGVEGGSLQDKLYLNDGKGQFTVAPPGTLPADSLSGSSAAVADFDRDGDLDLFVGTRVSPGKYPLSGPSRLLRNDSSAGKARFVDVTDDLCPELKNAGMVTSALWSDADGDGWLDLIITAEWEPVRLFKNDGGKKLADSTTEAGLSARKGWWHGIAGGDFDGDGDIDYAVTNFGLNTKYKVSEKKPARIYYGSFEEGGAPRIIEAKVAGNTLLPRRGKSCSTHAIPGLQQRFPTFHDFASATLEEIYTPDSLATSLQFDATELRSGIFINDGSGRFEFQPLPDLAQVAPSFGVVASDVDLDGFTDLVLAQNFFTPQRETGRLSAGLGVVLMGSAAGSFATMEPAESGIVVPEDAKSLAVADFNGDRLPDLIFGINDGPARIFLNTMANSHPAAVRLQGSPGNPNAIGARLRMVRADGVGRTVETHAGGGYLSQSSAVHYFGIGAADSNGELHIRWPDGKESKHTVKAGSQVRIQRPED